MKAAEANRAWEEVRACFAATRARRTRHPRAAACMRQAPTWRSSRASARFTRSSPAQDSYVRSSRIRSCFQVESRMSLCNMRARFAFHRSGSMSANKPWFSDLHGRMIQFAYQFARRGRANVTECAGRLRHARSATAQPPGGDAPGVPVCPASQPVITQTRSTSNRVQDRLNRPLALAGGLAHFDSLQW